MKWLTKSDYLKYLVSPAYLWLAKHNKAALPEFDMVGRFLMDQGNEVEAYARKFWPNGVLVASQLTDAVSDTEALVKASTPVIFQASVLTKRNLYCRADILVQQPDGTWDIYEVKSSTRVKSEHVADLAFQKIAFEEAGYRIGQLYVIHINGQYVRTGPVDAAQLLKTSKSTGRVDKALAQTKTNITAALTVIQLPNCPDDGPAGASNLSKWMPVWRHLNPDIATDSIYNLCRIKLAQIKRLQKAGFTSLSDVPTSFRLSPPQRAQIELAKLGRPAIDHLNIAAELQKLQFPLYFFDYETVAPAVPMYEGVQPYRALPFQYSLHVLPAPGATLEHHGFLARGGEYPALDLLKTLKSDLGPAGSVIVWFKPFEMGANDYLAKLHPEYAEFLSNLNSRIYDLMEIFSTRLYGHPDFYGSSSIKKVLPALIPEMSYKELGIQEGNTASISWLQAARGQLDGPTTQKLYADLIEYCGQDTLAMVRIYEHLLAVTTATAPV